METIEIVGHCFGVLSGVSAIVLAFLFLRTRREVTINRIEIDMDSPNKVRDRTMARPRRKAMSAKPTPGPVLIEASAFLARISGEVVAVFPYKEGDDKAEARAKAFSERFVDGVATREVIERIRLRTTTR